MSGSRLLPTEQRSTLRAAPTTSTWWRGQVLVRSWLNRHHRWLAPALLCAPPVGVAMLWAGATRPGQRRRWVTAGAAAWTAALVLAVVLLTLPGAQPADAGAAPRAIAGGAALDAPAATPTPSDLSAQHAASASAVRGAPAPGAGLGAAAVERSSEAEQPSSDASQGAETDPAGSGGAGAAGSGGSGAPAAPPASTPTTTTPRPPAATPTPRRTPATPPRTTPKPPSIPTADPFTPCSSEGAVALSPNGFSLKCYRTPIGLFWLWG